MSIRLHFVIGCTASGKSAVALELARRHGAELVIIDSMKIYRRMDIGTAKPTAAERAAVPHHLIDIVEPWETYSLGRFIEDADRVSREIAGRGRMIIAEGGTMMFVRGLVSGVFEGPSADPEFRRRIRERATAEGLPALHDELARVDPAAAQRIHPNDLRRIERALEVHHLTGTPISQLQTQWEQHRPGYDCRIAALNRPREELSRRINRRVHQMVAAGLVDEVRALLDDSRGIGDQAAQAVGYAELIRHLRGEIPFDFAVEQIKINTRHLAKSQRTWMRRIPGVRAVETSGGETTAQLADRIDEVWATPTTC